MEGRKQREVLFRLSGATGAVTVDARGRSRVIRDPDGPVETRKARGHVFSIILLASATLSRVTLIKACSLIQLDRRGAHVLSCVLAPRSAVVSHILSRLSEKKKVMYY